MSGENPSVGGRLECPVCGASQTTPGAEERYACRRCRADLHALIETRRSVAALAIGLFAASRRGDRLTAADHAARLEWLDPSAAALGRVAGEDSPRE
ncbi:hypothetical protein [Candidatus Laterigemmans baculatus]|uniref:hypothetical protein n=1 Tax=Candidatus Laterigemmans baculatus TaxID=2770505 RepID=UPI0013DBFDB4|nr:hypothetical protein [Candidatus Laterigemmans baculatus]